MFKPLLLGSVFAALASPAFAADMSMVAPTSSYNWTGPYLGAQIGYGWARDKIHDESRSTPGVSDYSDRFNLRGATGGIYGGYNYQMGMWLFGAEGDMEISDVNGDNAAWPFGTDMTAKIRAQGSLRGRLGYVYDTSLFYVTGGLAFGDIKTDYYDTPAHDSYSRWRAGWTVGAGVEHAFTPHWTARLEYRYTDFGRITDWTATTDSGWNEHNDITEHAVRVGISYKF